MAIEASVSDDAEDGSPIIAQAKRVAAGYRRR
jgi:hypothetical protein